MTTLNLGILAHVDAGKTSLTERLLHAAGVIDEIGSVDAGSTQTDTLALERQRGITIKSAVVSFVLGDVTVNLIDTPGHPDFIAEVERVLSVLDGAVLVISAVEGVQAQTRVLMRTLQRLRIPAVIFVNKIDRSGADLDRVLQATAAKLTPAIIPMGLPSGLGTRGCGFRPYGPADAGFRAMLADLVTQHDDALLAAYLDDEASVSCRQLRGRLAALARRAVVHPVFAGSAITGTGVDALTAGITELLPPAGGDPDGPVSGTVFKVERGPAGEKIAYARMFSGTVRTRERLRFGNGGEAKVTAVSVFDRGSAVPGGSVTAGRIGKLWGLRDVRIGDPIGDPLAGAGSRHFPPPTLETVVVPCRPADKGALHIALTQLAEQDPLINLRQDDIRQEILVSLYGEVQKEVIQATLAADFGVEAGFRETTIICVERLAGTGAAVEALNDPGNPFKAGVGLRIEPAPPGAGMTFRLEIEPGSLPVPFRKAIAATAEQTLRQGLHGWEVSDCTVYLTHSGYIPPQGKRGIAFDPSISSAAGDFRDLTPLVLMSALRQAGTRVCEPVQRCRLEVPADTLRAVLPALTRLGGVPRATEPRGSSYLLEAELPASRVHDLEQQLPALTRGESVLDCTFSRYRPVRGPAPARPRTDHNPLNRKEYLQHVMRGVAGPGDASGRR